MQHCENKAINSDNSDKKEIKSFKFVSIDTEFSNLMKDENTTEDDIKIKDLFEQVLSEGLDSKGDKGEVNKKDIEIQKLKSSASPAYFKVDEQMKRFSQMAQGMGQEGLFPVKKTLIINPSNSLIQNAYKIHEKGNNKELVKKICLYVEDLASISSEGLNKEGKDIFVKRSQELLSDLTNLAL